MNQRTNLSPGGGKKSWVAFLVALSAVALFVSRFATSVQATPSLTPLHEFTAPVPTRPIQAKDGNFYGALSGGLPKGYGSIYKLGPDGTETVIYQFSGPDGANPVGALVQGSDGNLYGTTTNGGVYGFGTIYKLTTAGQLTSLHSFAVDEGWRPGTELVQDGAGNLYGTTPFGGAHLKGTVFKLTPAGIFTTLHDFSDYNLGPYTNSDGSFPETALAFGSDGNLYGTTTFGGTIGYGTIFKISPAGSFQTLHSFDGTDGYLPQTPLLPAAEGGFYGTTFSGGASHDGNLFKVSPDGMVTTIYSFNVLWNPEGAILMGADGEIYGAASSNVTTATGTGGIYKINSAGVLRSVYLPGNGTVGSDNTIGYAFQTGIIQGSDGNIYGVSSAGGTGQGSGVFFKIIPATSDTAEGTASTFHSFTESGEVAISVTAATAPNGDLYGTANNEPKHTASIYQLTAAGGFTSLHEFGLNSVPTPLTLGSDGNFYGATGRDGDDGAGTIYRLTPQGTFTLLHSFNDQYHSSEGYNPRGALVQGPDGLLNGTCFKGGVENLGTYFRCSTTGDFQLNWVFQGAEGAYPVNPLAFGDNGLLFGVTYFGGASYVSGGTAGLGSIFTQTASGGLVNLYSFTNGADGFEPQGGLVKGTDGNFYGTSNSTVFRITQQGVFTTLYTFTGGGDGTGPAAALLLASDGNFYGTTQYGGIAKVTNSFTPEGFGTIFKITPAGELTTLHVFTGGTDGGNPSTPLVQGPDGNLYGGAGVSQGGFGGNGGLGGALFRLDINAPATHATFFAGETALADNVYYLSFQTGRYFGYYVYFSDPAYIYHFDLGFEYVIDADDAQGGAYFYDFASRTFFYTSPTFPFPYLYDFSLDTVLYYYPDPTNLQRYNTNGVRYFYNFSTGKVISK